MKPLFVLLKIAIVGILWSVLFIEGIRVILLTNWHFDIFRTSHWIHAWTLWRSGWVIDESKEWAFILIILTAIPVWATVWAALSIIKWDALIQRIFNFISQLFRSLYTKLFGNTGYSRPKAKPIKKISTKEAKLRNPHSALEKSTPNLSPERRAQLSGIPYKPQPVTSASTSTPKPKAEPKEFSHSLFEIGDDEPLDFDIFDDKAFSEPAKASKESGESSTHNNETSASSKKKKDNTSAENKGKNYHSNSTFELLKQKGYEIISGITIDDISIDFVGISKNHLCLCLNDKEPGDWLADEERFNDEEPLWFSESSHRISPVRKIAIAKAALEQKLAAADFKFEIIPYVIEQIGNIINAEDMFDIWKDLNINVTRIDRGTPKEIPLFAKKLEDAEGGLDKSTIDKLKKLLRNNN